MASEKSLIEFRCPTPSCGRLLFKVSELPGIEVEVRCPKCKHLVEAELRPADGEER